VVYGKYRRRIELQKFNVGVCLSSCSRYMFYWLRHRFYCKRLCFTPQSHCCRWYQSPPPYFTRPLVD